MNLAEIQAAIAADPALKSGLYAAIQPDVLAAVKATGMIVRTKEEDTAFMTNYDNTHLQSKVDAEVATQIGAKQKATWDAIDEKVFAATGIKKNPNEKTTDYVDRAAKEIKAAGGSDENLKQLYTQAQQSLEAKKDFVDPKELEKLKTDHFNEKVSLHIAMAQEGVTFAVPAHITDEKEKQEYIASQKRFLAADMMRFKPKQDKDGNLIWHDADGNTPKTDTATGKPLTAAQLMTDAYKGFFVPAKGKGGAGSGASGAGGNAGDPEESSLKNKTQVNEYLKKKYPDAPIGDKKRTDEYTRIITEQGITAEE